MHSIDYVPRRREWWRGIIRAIPLGGDSKLVPLSAHEIETIRESLRRTDDRLSPDERLEGASFATLEIRFGVLAGDDRHAR